jgi:hypothetical protein
VKYLRVFVSLLLLSFILPAAVHAQESEDQLTLSLNRDFGYGGFGGEIQGRFSFRASGPADLEQVAFYMDGQLVGNADAAPFRFQFSTGDYSPGIHTLSAIGYTTGGETLHSNQLTRHFLTAEEAHDATTGLVFPLLGALAAIAVIGVVVTALLGRRKGTKTVGDYSQMAGGAVCSRCGLPFSRHVLSPNLFTGKLERCPHCGKWSVARRASPAELEQAEARLRAEAREGTSKIEETAEERLRRQIEASRFED